MEPLGWCFQQRLELGDCDLTIKILVFSVAKLAKQHFLHTDAFTKLFPFSRGLFIFYCTVINSHKGSILKQHRFIIFQFHRSGIWIRSNWANIKELAEEQAPGKTVFLPFPVAGTRPRLLAHGPSFLHLQSQQWLVNSLWCFKFFLPLFLSSHPSLPGSRKASQLWRTHVIRLGPSNNPR